MLLYNGMGFTPYVSTMLCLAPGPFPYLSRVYRIFLLLTILQYSLSEAIYSAIRPVKAYCF